MQKARVVAVAFAGLAAFVAVGAPALGATIAPAVTVADTIEARRVLDFGAGKVLVSPHAQRYVMLVTRGDLARNGNWVDVYSGELQSLAAATPRKVASLFTTGLAEYLTGAYPPTHPASNHVGWLDDDRRITLLWTPGEEPTQVFSIDVISGEIRALTDHSSALQYYGTSPDGKIIVFEAYPSLRHQAAHLPGATVTTENMSAALIEGSFSGVPRWRRLETFAMSPRTASEQRIIERDVLRRGSGSAGPFSPDGRYVLSMRNATDIHRAEWGGYPDQKLQSFMARNLQDPEGGWIMVTSLIDLQKATKLPLWRIPSTLEQPTRAAWSPDSRAVVIGPTFLPPEMKSDAGNAGRAVAVLDIESGAIAELPVADGDAEPQPVRWAASGEIEITAGKKLRVYRKADGQWHEVVTSATPAGSATTEHITVELKQDANTPPALFATDVRSHKTQKLMEIEPRWHAVRLGRVEMITWRDPQQREWHGRIYFPLDYRKGQRYPLVLQTHGFAPADEFSVLGNGDRMTTAFAAQPLAAAGMLVLQMQDYDDTDYAEEADIHMSGHESGIAELERRGYIDRDRVGLMGFSRTGWHIEYTLSRSDFPFAAALASDNVGYGYIEAALLSRFEEYSPVNGGLPFGAGMASWLEKAPPFNAERIRAPLRLEAASGGTVGALAHWELFTRMRENRLPVELFVVPDGERGTHPLQNPLQRLASEQGAVDWFNFWLNDREDGDLAKADQYARWRELRAQRDAAQKLPRPARLKWTATPVE